jgi:hypothetical protein
MRGIVKALMVVLMLKVWWKGPSCLTCSKEELSGVAVQYLLNDNRGFLLIRKDDGKLDSIEYQQVIKSQWVDVKAEAE